MIPSLVCILTRPGPRQGVGLPGKSQSPFASRRHGLKNDIRTTLFPYPSEEPFKADDRTPIGEEKFYMAHSAGHHDIAVDTHGSLQWPEDARADNLLVITDERCPREYHKYLMANGISWIAFGKDTGSPVATELLRLLQFPAGNVFLYFP